MSRPPGRGRIRPVTDTTTLLYLALFLMLAALFLVPLGLPGIWIMIGILTVATAYGEVAPWLLLFLVAAGAAAEAVEWVILKRTSARWGASRTAFWGAVAGGLIGVLIGVPIPVLGSLVAGLLGTFAGAAAVALAETRRFRDAGRVAWGALLGRVFAAAFKTAVAIGILVLGAAALLL